MTLQPPKKLDALTTLRFFAAAMIVLHHSVEKFGIPHDVGGPFILEQAVSFFFVLSGFILTYVYPRLDTWQARGRFWLARVARIWPAHLAAFLLLWILLQKPAHFPTGESSLATAALNLLLIHGWIPLWNVFFSYNAVSWTISTEMGFYLLFPLLIWRWEKTWWFKVPLALAMALVFVMICHWGNIPGNPPNKWQVSSTGLLYVNPLARLFEFTIGMATCLLFRRTIGKIRFAALLGTLLEVAAIALVVLNMYFTVPLVELPWLAGWSGRVASTWALYGPISVFSFALLIYVMAVGRGYISRTLATPPGIILGELSFTIYLLHQILLTFFQWKYACFEPYDNLLGYAFFWLILLVLAWLVWACFERPLRARVLALWPSRDPHAIASHLSRAYATPPRASHWSAIMAPTRRAIIGGAVLFLLLLLPVGAALVFPAKASPAAIRAIVAATPPDIRGARFDDKLELLGYQLLPSSTGMQLKLACRPLPGGSGHFSLALHFVNAQGAILAQAGFEEDPARFRSPREPWIDTITITSSDLAGAHSIALVIYRSGKFTSTVDRGPRDWTNHRLLLPLP